MEALSVSPLSSSSLELDCLPGNLMLLDRCIFFAGAILIILGTLVLIIAAIRFKEVRSQPGDIILAIAISDALLAVHWLVLSIWPDEIENGTFCTALGALGIFAGLSEFLYNTAFSIFLIISLRNSLTQSKIPKRIFHLINFAIVGLFIAYAVIHKQIGKTWVGTCSIKSSCSPDFYNYAGVGIVLVYAIIGIATFCYVRKNAPQCARAHSKRTRFLLYYLCYIITSIIIYSVIAGINLMQAFLNANFSDTTNEHSIRMLRSLFNIATLCSPLVLSIVRFNDPLIRKAMRRTLCCRRSRVRNSQVEAPLIQTEMKNESIISSRDQNESSMSSFEFTFNQLNYNRKLELTYTLVSCIIYAHYEKIFKVVPMTQSMRHSERNVKDPYRQEKTFLIDDESIKRDLPAVREELERKRVNILPGSLTVYAPRIFGGVLSDVKYIDMLASLDLAKNYEQLKIAGRATSGKGGEFFFFSEDNKFVIKTISDKELNVLLNILERYERHFQIYPNSLIAKIFGAFTFGSSERNFKVNLIVIQNSCGFSSQYINRVYDIKGSRYGRETLRGHEVSNRANLSSFVLKDLDFEKFEEGMFLEESTKKAFLRQITADSLFLRDARIIDYSLVVYYVDKEKFRENVEANEEEPADDFTENNPLASMRNLREPGLYYNLGIIDYLQPYTFKRAVERFVKKLQKLNPHLEVSCQNPEYYSERFIDFIKKIVA